MKKMPKSFLKYVFGNPERPCVSYEIPLNYPFTKSKLSNPDKIGLDEHGGDDFDKPSFKIGDEVYVITRSLKIRKTFVTGIDHYGPPNMGYLIRYQINDVYFPGPGNCSSDALYTNLEYAKLYLAWYRLYGLNGLRSQKTFIKG